MGHAPALKEASPVKPRSASTDLISYEPMKSGQEGNEEDDVEYEVVRGETGVKGRGCAVEWGLGHARAAQHTSAWLGFGVRG